MSHTTQLNSYEFSTIDLAQLTNWPPSVIEDYRSLHETVLQLIDAIRAISSLSDIPATATSAGEAGQIANDNDFFYVCIADNVWKRSPLTTW